MPISQNCIREELLVRISEGIAYTGRQEFFERPINKLIGQRSDYILWAILKFHLATDILLES